MSEASRGGFPPGIEFQAPTEEKKLKPIEITAEKVSVLGVEIPRSRERGPRAPDPEKFKDFSEDKFSLDLLQRIAKAEVLDQPLLLEGEAAVGKSYTIEYLAHLANREVYRMSLNGQTDTTDLIGKWVPRTTGLRKLVERLLDDPAKCKTGEARAIIELKQVKVKKEAREEAIEKGREKAVYIGFDKEGMEEICRLEGIEVPEGEWTWQDGDIPKQMKNGAWSVLDEINTCEPQILVRLNALLERGGQLVLHEDGSKIIPRHPNFRLFATVNPPGGRYKGRVPLSAEWISRWNYQNIGDIPQETAALRFKKRLGVKPPKIKPEELNFAAPEEIPEKKTMADYYGEEWAIDLGDRYEEFRYKAREMVKKGEIAKDQTQIFDFDQRDDVRFEEYLRKFREPGNMKKVIEEAIEYYFSNKLKDKADRKKLKDVALGLIKISEPKEILSKGERESKKQLTRVKAELAAMGLTEELLKI